MLPGVVRRSKEAKKKMRAILRHKAPTVGFRADTKHLKAKHACSPTRVQTVWGPLYVWKRCYLFPRFHEHVRLWLGSSSSSSSKLLFFLLFFVFLLCSKSCSMLFEKFFFLPFPSCYCWRMYPCFLERLEYTEYTTKKYT